MASSIGKLNILIGASAGEFEKVTAGVEKKMLSLASMATSIPRSLLGGFENIGGGITGSLDHLMKTADTLVRLTPGGKALVTQLGLDEGVAGITESGKRGIAEMRRLRREAERFDISPGFLKAAELALGPDAEIAGKIVDKVADALGKLREGDEGMLKSLKAYEQFLDMAKLSAGGPREAILQLADAYKNLGDRVEGLNMIGLFTGNKLADDAHYLFSGGRGKLLGFESQVSQGGLLNSDVLKASDAANSAQKYIERLKAERDARNAMREAAKNILDLKYQKGEIGYGEWWSRWTDVTVGGLGFAKAIVDEHVGKEAKSTDRPKTQVNRAALLAKDNERKANEQLIAQQTLMQQKTMEHGAAITESLMTPQEKLAENVNDVTQSLINGAISWDTYNRAMARAAQGFAQAGASAGLPGLRLQGSQGAFDLIDRQAPRSGQDELINTLRSLMLANQGEFRNQVAQIINVLKERSPEPNVANFQ